MDEEDRFSTSFPQWKHSSMKVLQQTGPEAQRPHGAPWECVRKNKKITLKPEYLTGVESFTTTTDPRIQIHARQPRASIPGDKLPAPLSQTYKYTTIPLTPTTFLYTLLLFLSAVKVYFNIRLVQLTEFVASQRSYQ